MGLCEVERKTELSLAPLKRIIKQESGDMVNIGQEALEVYRDMVEDMARDLARELQDAAYHAGRKTIKKTDVVYVKTLRESREGEG